MIFQYKTTETLENKTRIEYAWDTGDKEYSETCVFDHGIDAQAYIKSCIQTALLIRYQKFVWGLKKAHTQPGTDEKLWQNNYLKAESSLHYFANSQLTAIKKYMLQMAPKLQSLLPKLTNPNEYLLKKELEEIIDFVKNEI